MTNLPDLFEYARLTASTPAVDFLELDPFNPAPFDDWTPLGPELPLESVPLVCRFPGEPGAVELDRFGRVKGSAA